MTRHALNHWFTDNIIQFMNQHWWENVGSFAVQRTYLTCPTWPRYNAETLSTLLPDICQMDVILLFQSHGYKYVLVMVCMFSPWTEAFPCRQANAPSVANALLQEIVPTWELLMNSVVVEEPTVQVCAVCPVLHFHCAYTLYPQV